MKYKGKAISAEMLSEKMAKTWTTRKKSFIERALSEAGTKKVKSVKLTKDNVISPFEFVSDDIDYHPCSKCPCKYNGGIISGIAQSCQNPYSIGSGHSVKSHPIDPPDCFVYTDTFGYIKNLEEQVLFLQNKKPSARAVKLANRILGNDNA